MVQERQKVFQGVGAVSGKEREWPYCVICKKQVNFNDGGTANTDGGIYHIDCYLKEKKTYLLKPLFKKGKK